MDETTNSLFYVNNVKHSMFDKDTFICIRKANTSKNLQLHLSKMLTKFLWRVCVTNINVHDCRKVVNNVVTL